jgi:hypothetical protein
VKSFLIFGLFCFSLIAADIVIKDEKGRLESYTIVPKGMQKKSLEIESGKENRYYLYGDPNMEAISNGFIIIAFKTPVNIDEFSAKYNLLKAGAISEKKLLYLFENKSAFNDLSLCAEITAQNSEIRYARPDFKSNAKIE